MTDLLPDLVEYLLLRVDLLSESIEFVLDQTLVALHFLVCLDPGVDGRDVLCHFLQDLSFLLRMGCLGFGQFCRNSLDKVRDFRLDLVHDSPTGLKGFRMGCFHVADELLWQQRLLRIARGRFSASTALGRSDDTRDDGVDIVHGVCDLVQAFGVFQLLLGRLNSLSVEPALEVVNLLLKREASRPVLAKLPFQPLDLRLRPFA